MADLIALRKRVRVATGPDRELANAFCLAFMDRADYPSIAGQATNALLHGSVDGALALVERLLPGWRRSVYERDIGRWEAVLGLNFDGRTDKGPHEVKASQKEGFPSAPLAILDALLTALIDQETARG